MNRDSDKNFGVPSSGSPPSEAWLFAQEILGKPISRVVNPAATASAERQQLEWLAQFSSSHALELRRLQSAEIEASRERELLEWAAQISTRGEGKLRVLQRQEAEALEGWRSAEQFADTLLEGNWDPSQHPRAPKGQPSGGRWVEKGGGGVGILAATGTPTTTASYSGPKKVDAQPVSWPPPVGHHWVPVGVTQDPNIRPLLSDEAVEYATGAYSGPTDPHHGNTTVDEVTHDRYNAEVKAELQKFINQNKIKKMTAAQMEEFTALIEKGLGGDGKPHDFIGRYNKAIKFDFCTF